MRRIALAVALTACGKASRPPPPPARLDAAPVAWTHVIDAGPRSVDWRARCLDEVDSDPAPADAVLDAPEVKARDVVARASAGDLVGALDGLHHLPPTWDLMVWQGWLGSAAMTACVALASDAVASDPRARDLLDAAVHLTEKVDEDWRQNREWAAIAATWRRLGEPEEAIDAATHMPGTERAGTLAAVLRDLDPDLPADRFEGVAKRALDGVGGSKAITLEPGLDDFVASATTAEVVAALTVAYVRRDALDAARARMASIPENLAARWYALGALHCGEGGDLPDFGTTFEVATTNRDAFWRGSADAGCEVSPGSAAPP